MINSTLNESGMVVGFEASDDAEVFWLDTCSEVQLEVVSSDVLQVGRDDVAIKVLCELDQGEGHSSCVRGFTRADETVSLIRPDLI